MKKKLIIIIGIAVVVLAAAAFFLLMPKEGKVYFYATGDPFVTNVLESDKLVKTTVVLGISKEADDALKEKSPLIRDCILYTLRSQSEEQFMSKDMQTVLSKSIVDQLNTLIPVKDGKPPVFVKAYFNDFVMQ